MDSPKQIFNYLLGLGPVAALRWEDYGRKPQLLDQVVEFCDIGICDLVQ